LETERKLAEDIKVKKKERNTNRNELKKKDMNKEIKRMDKIEKNRNELKKKEMNKEIKRNRTIENRNELKRQK